MSSSSNKPTGWLSHILEETIQEISCNIKKERHGEKKREFQVVYEDDQFAYLLHSFFQKSGLKETNLKLY